MSALALFSGACKPQSQTASVPEVWTLAASHLVLVQAEPGVIVAHDGTTGAVRWRYRHTPTTHAPYGERPPEEIVCPVVDAPAGFVLLRFHEQLHAVDLVDGRRRWNLSLKTYRFCPAVAPDSTVVLVARWGEALEKLDQDGKRAWMIDLAPFGVAVSPPSVLFPSGDVLVQTTRHVVSFSPTGVKNWQVPVDPDAKDGK